MLGKWIDENFDVLSKEFNNIISIKISRYYTNSFNIVNPVLSRNINSSNIFRYFCEYKYNNKLPTQVLVKNKVIKLIKYYLKSFIYFIFILIHLFIYKLAYKKYNFHIVSGAEHKELNRICDTFDLSEYFITIDGSPTKKDILVKNVLEKYDYSQDESILIGDAITDYNATIKNGIAFYGYNNQELEVYDNYIKSFKELSFEF